MTCPRASTPGIFARPASSFGAVSPCEALERGLNELDVRVRVEESASVRLDLDGKRGFSGSPEATGAKQAARHVLTSQKPQLRETLPSAPIIRCSTKLSLTELHEALPGWVKD